MRATTTPKKMLKFITGNKQKFAEISRFLYPIKVQQIKINLEELQEIDPHKVIKHKLKQAFKHRQGQFIVDDESVYFDCLVGKLPGPFVKWFNQTIGPKGLWNIAKKMGNQRAHAKSLIGYAKNPKHIVFFEGKTQGKIVSPKGSYLFGYDPVFVPKTSSKTFAELKAEGKFELSPRYKSVAKLKKYLLK